MNTMRLGNHVLKIGSGATPRGGQDVYQASGVALIRSQNVYNNSFSFDGLVYIDDDEAWRLNNVVVEPNDVLLNITGDSVARVCQVPNEVLPARVNQHVAIIRPKPDEIDATFLRYFLVSPQMQDYLLSIAGAGATRNALTKGMIENFQIPALDVLEQRAIAAILSSFDDKIEANRRQNATLEATAHALFQSWFVDFDPVRAKAQGHQPDGMDADTAALFPDGFEDSALGAIPQGWQVSTLGDVIEFVYGKALKAEDRISGPFPVYGSNGQIGWHDSYLSPMPGIIVGRKGNPGTVNWSQVPFYVIDTAFYVKVKSEDVPLEYLQFMLESINIPNFAADSAVPGLNRNAVATIRIAIPPLPVLKQFKRIIEPIFLGESNRLDESRTLAQTRDALLPKLISGQVRVGDGSYHEEGS